MKLGRRRFLGWLGATAAAGTTAQALAKSVSPPEPVTSYPVPLTPCPPEVPLEDLQRIERDLLGDAMRRSNHLYGPAADIAPQGETIPFESTRVTLDRPLSPNEQWQMRVYLDGLRRRPIA